MACLFGGSRFREKIATALSLILCSVLLAPALVGQNLSQPSWKPNQALLTRLAAPAIVDEFQIRPPKGYELQTLAGPHGSQATAWASPPRQDGTRAQVMVLTVTLPPEELARYNVGQILDEFVARLSEQRKNWKRAPTEQGFINGLRFVRTRWEGTDIATGYKMHGFNYITLVGGKVIQLSSQDIEPHHTAALELAEASALTFRKQ